MTQHKGLADIPGWEGKYAASTDGRIYSYYTDRYLKPSLCKGYPKVGLCYKGDEGRKYEYHYVHRLVLSAHVGACPDGMEGCHNDGDPTNNKLANLRWDTKKGNSRDKLLHGTHQYGSRNPNYSYTEDIIDMILHLWRSGYTQENIGKLINRGRGSVSYVIKRYGDSYGGVT